MRSTVFALLAAALLGIQLHAFQPSRAPSSTANGLGSRGTRHQRLTQIQAEKKGNLLELLISPNLSIAAGSIGFVALLVNRLSLEVVSAVQSRSDIISVVACSALLLNVLSDQDIDPRERDAVALAGYALQVPLLAEGLDAACAPSSWLINTILSTAIDATSVHVIADSRVLAAGGVVGSGERLPALAEGSSRILSDALASGQLVYLPDLQILPGKVEFSYLPINCQSVLVVPLGDAGSLRNVAVVVGTNRAKCFKFNDLNKIRSTVDVFTSLL